MVAVVATRGCTSSSRWFFRGDFDGHRGGELPLTVCTSYYFCCRQPTSRIPQSMISSSVGIFPAGFTYLLYSRENTYLVIWVSRYKTVHAPSRFHNIIICSPFHIGRIK